MKPGSVIVDMAAEQGRQLPADRSRQDGGQARRARSSARPTCRRWWRPTPRALYARNVLDFLKLVLDQGRAASSTDGRRHRRCLPDDAIGRSEEEVTMESSAPPSPT
jgi:hypothetical protein